MSALDPTFPTSYQPAGDRFEVMNYRPMGRSGLLLPVLSLGFWHNFGLDRGYDTQREIVRAAFDAGITHWDLANNYGPPSGGAEVTAGRLLRDDFAAHRDDLVLTTKAGFVLRPGPYGTGGSKKYLLSSLESSLRLFGTDHVDVFYHHRPCPITPLEETAEALAETVTSGKARYVGLSNYSAAGITEMAALLADRGVPLRVHQGPWSLFDRSMEADIVPATIAAGAGVVAYSPLQQGLLTDRYLSGEIPAGSRAATGKFLHEDALTPHYFERAAGLRAIAAERGQTLAELALTWVLSRPGLASAVIGASSVAQLQTNLAVLSAAPLTAEQAAAIEPFAVHGTGARTW